MFKVVNKIIRQPEGVLIDDHRDKLIYITNTIENESYELKEKIHLIDKCLTKYKRPNKIDRQEFIFNKMSNWFHEYILTKKTESTTSFSMLDIGGGNGYILSKFGEKYDLDPSNLICLENKNGHTEFLYDYNLSNIKYCFDANVLLSNDETFDIIICMVSLHHMSNEHINNIIIPLIKLKLKDNGVLLIKEHDAYSPEVIEKIHWEHHLYNIIDTPSLVDVNTYLRNYIGNYKSKIELEELLQKKGFCYLYTFSNVFEHVNNSYSGEDNKTPTKLYWQLYKITK